MVFRDCSACRVNTRLLHGAVMLGRAAGAPNMDPTSPGSLHILTLIVVVGVDVASLLGGSTHLAC